MEGISFCPDWDAGIIEFVQNFASPVFTDIMSAFTMLGEEILLIALLGYLYLCVDKRKGRNMAMAMLVALLGGMILKNAFLRRRPYFDNPGIRCLRAPTGGGDIMDIAVQGYSFPSLHSANAIVISGSLLSLFRKKWVRIILLILPFIIGFSRIYLGVHYPTDVITGWIIGLLALTLVSFILRRCSNWLVLLLALGLIALPGWFICKTDDFFSAYGLMAGMFLAFHLEERIVNFKNIPNSWRSVIRLLCGLVVFFGTSQLLKIPFDKDFLDCGSFAAHLVRAFRYAAASFIAMGIYPMLFKHTDRLWCRKSGKTAQGGKVCV